MNKISINKCVGGAWDLTTKNWIMCIIVLVGSFVFSIISHINAPTEIYDYTNMTPEEMARIYPQILTNSFGEFTLVAYIVQYAIFAGLYKMAINGYNGKKVDTSAYKMPFATYVKFIAASIAYGILTTVGAIFLIIPGIYLAVRLLFAPIILLDEPETELIEAFKKSWAMTSGNFWSLLTLGVEAVLLIFLGLVCCCVGVIFTGVMTIFMEAIAYYQLKDNAPVAGPEALETI